MSIERIVLDGLPISTHDRGAFLAAFTSELEQLMAEPRIWGGRQATRHCDRLSTPVLSVPPDSTPRQLGQRLAMMIATSVVAQPGTDPANLPDRAGSPQ